MELVLSTTCSAAEGALLARGITVHREGADESLYDKPLGSESVVRELWSDPATVLGLPLLADVYEYGFQHCNKWSGPQLSQVLDEVSRLEEYWASAGLPADALAGLQQRAGYCVRRLPSPKSA